MARFFINDFTKEEIEQINKHLDAWESDFCFKIREGKDIDIDKGNSYFCNGCPFQTRKGMCTLRMWRTKYIHGGYVQ